MAESTPASVTLLDLANDLDYWVTQVRQIGIPGTDETQKLSVQGLSDLAEVVRAYSNSGFRMEPR